MKARLFGLLGRTEPAASGVKRSAAPSQKKEARPNRYQAVTIATGSKRCEAVKSLAGQRFLAGSAPSLPLPTCSLSNQCKCSFRKHDDRRDSDRRFPGEIGRWYGGAEKRRFRGRRGTD